MKRPPPRAAFLFVVLAALQRARTPLAGVTPARANEAVRASNAAGEAKGSRPAPRQPSRCPGIGERERRLPAAYAGVTKHAKNGVKIGSRVSVRDRRGAGDQATLAHFLWQTVRRDGADLISRRVCRLCGSSNRNAQRAVRWEGWSGCRDPSRCRRSCRTVA